MKEIDKQVLEWIQQLNKLNIKVSIRKVANLLNKQNSLRSVQLSFERLENNNEIIKDDNWWFYLTKEEDERVDLIINISISELWKLKSLKEMWMINFLIK